MVRDLSRNPLFQVMFAYQSNLAAELHLPGMKTEPMEFARQLKVRSDSVVDRA